MKYALLIFYAAGTLAAPFIVLDDNLPKTEIKGVGCSSSRFRQGQQYAYDYAGETINNIEGASTHSTGLKVTARVFITPLSECKFSMQVSNSELLTKSKNQEFSPSADSAKLARELEKYELLFSMSGDKITKLVAHNEEPVHILNMKRGILSTMQVDKDGKTETDVNGVCETSVTMENGNVIETKKLSDCSKRAQNEYGIQTSSFKTETSIKPLDSTSKCTYVLSNGNIKKVFCEETHIFKPFSAGYESPSGAMTFVRQSLRSASYKMPVSDVQFADYTTETTLIFDHTNEETKSTIAMSATVESIMNTLVKKDSLSAQQESAHEFTALVMVLRKMNEKALKPVWDKYFDCIKSGTCKKTETDLQSVYRQYLLDAIAYCGSSTCVSFVRDVIIDGEVNGERVNMFLQSIALVGQTAKDMIKDVLEIAKKQPSRQAYLTLGTLMYRHCNKMPKECEFEKRNPISEAEVFLEEKLGKACGGQDNHDRVEEILMALKSIGNAKRPLRVRGTLLKCAEVAKHSNITHSIFNAFQNMQCDGQFTDQLLEFIKNEDIDPEKRIHAFAAAMKCPTEYVLERLIKMLEKEPSRQVASYMWTHLSNIVESSDPKNEIARELLKKLTKTNPLKVVDLAYHQYSRFFEKSLHSKTLKSGATAEGQVIFHPDGYFPRTGKLNIKANILGNPIDIFETMVHVEGLEDLCEDALGPNGVLPKDFLFNIFNYTMTAEKFRELVRQREEKTRPKRAANLGGKLNNIHDRVNMKPSKPTAHFNIKVMGQEIRVMSYDDLYWMIDQIDNMNVIQVLMDVAKGGHKTLSKSMMFLEMSHIVPTGVGMPLKLKLTGSTVATVELDGKFDIRNMFWGPGSVIVKGYVKPSAVVEVAGQMGIDSGYGTAGIFVNSSMFVSHLTKGNIIYRQGQLLKINIDTPEKPVELFNVSSTPFMYMNEKVDLIEGTARKINPDYCVKSKIIGYGLCSSLRLPVAYREYEAPYFPLSGPAHFGVKLVRGDEKLTTFQFQIKMAKKSKEMIGDIEFSTPGAYYERKLSGQMRYTEVWGQKTLTIFTEKNGKNAQLQFSYNPNSKRHFIEASTNVFTPKPVVSKLEVFNTNNPISTQYGLSYTLTYDWYKFEHVTKYVKKATGYMLHSSTLYYPKKSVTGVLEYVIKDQKLTARFDANQLKQAFEISGQLKKTAAGKGVMMTGTHLTSGKSASIYMGYVNTENKKEFITEVVALSKRAKSTIGYYNRNGLKSLETFIDVEGKTGKIVASLDNGKITKKVEMSFLLNGKQSAVSTIVLTNKDNEKSLLMTATAAGKTAESKMGYYKKSGEDTVKVEVDLAGRKAEMFFTLISAEGYRYTFGGVVGKYNAGVRGLYNARDGKKACISMYYGTKDLEKEPLMACVNYDSLSKKYTHKRLSFFLELKNFKKTAELIIEAKKQGQESTLISTVNYMGKPLAIETIGMKYADLMNTEIRYVLAIGKYAGGFKLFTRSQKAKSQVGIEGHYMDKTIMLINKFVSQKMGKATDRSVTTELIVNGKTLPVSTTFNLFSEKGAIGPSAKLTVGKYSVVYATMINYVPTEYSWNDELVIAKESKSLLKYYKKSVLLMTEEKKEMIYKFGVVAFDKTYEYGWEAAYQNRGSVSKSARDLTFRLQYSTTRKSVITFTFANSKRTAELLINFEYIPKKMLSHSIVYDYKLRQLDVDIEFLPKMHTKFMARLDKKNGYKFTTDFGIQWKKYKRSMKMVNTFKNTKNVFDVSTSFGDNVKFGISLSKNYPKTLKFGAKIMKTNIKIVTTLMKKVIRLNIVKNGRVVVNVGLGFSKIGRSWTVALLKNKNTVFKLSGDYNRFLNKVTLTAVSGKKQLVELSGRFDKAKKTISATVSAFRKPMFKVIAKKGAKMVSIKFVAPKMKRDITFVAEVNKKSKSLTLSAESGKHKVGMEVRADWKNMVMSLNGFYNSKVVGMSVVKTDSAIIYAMTFAPEVSMKVIFEIKDDRVLRMTVRRQAGKSFIDEFSTQYKLSRKMSQIAFKWNTKYFKQLSAYVTPIVKSYIKDMDKLVNELKLKSTTFIKKTTKQMTNAVFDFVDNVDNSFDSMNFVEVRDRVGTTALKGMKGMSSLVEKAFKKLIKALEIIKKELPGMTKKLNKVTMETIKYMRTLPGLTQKNLKELKERVDRIKSIVLMVAKNLTESSKPVINKAIELVKEFKLRGKTVKEIVVIVQDVGQKYIKIYTEEAKVQWGKLQIKAKEMYGKTTKYVLKMKIPYRKETIAEVIEIILAKIEEIKQKVENIDAKKMMDKARDYVMKYNVQGKPVKEYMVTMKKQLATLKKQFKNMPEKTRKLIHQLIKLIREYSNQVEIVYGKVVKFSEPLTKHVIFVKDSAVKRFGPLYKEAVAKFEKELAKIKLPTLPAVRPYLIKQWKLIEEFFLPLVQPMKPLYRNFVKQVRQLKVIGFRVGPMVDMNVNMVNMFVESYARRANKMVKEQMDIMNNYVEKYSMKYNKMAKMTPEQMVDMGFESSADMSDKVVKYVTEMYNKRQEWIKSTTEEIKDAYKKIEAQYKRLQAQSKDLYKKLSSKTPEEVLESFYKNAEQRILDTVEELTSIAKQLAALEVAQPSWKAWKQADILGHLNKYGVNKKVSGMIKSLKDVKLTKVIMDSVKYLKDLYNAVYSKAFVKAVQTYGKLEKVYNYIQSIPKKDYEEWYNELKQFTLKNKATFVKIMTENYEMTKTEATKLYASMKQLSTKNFEQYKKMYNDYSKPAKEVYNRVAKQSQLFYDDVKEPTIVVATHYKDFATTFANKHYVVYRDIVVKAAKKLQKEVEMKINELKSKVEAEYERFLNKYGDMTWEQVGDEIVKYGEEKAELAKKMYNKQYKEIEVLVAKYKKEAKKLVAKAKEQYKKYLERFNTEIKPKVMAKYEEYKTKAEVIVTKYNKKAMKMLNELKQQLNDLKQKGIKIYNANKDKTLKAIYIEIKNIIVKEFNKQFKAVVTIYNKKTKEATTLAKKYYQKADTLVRDVILPELKKECVSLINQCLRNSVVMTEEAVKAYKPHYRVVKREATKYSKVLSDKAAVVYENSKVELKKNMDKMIRIVKEFLETVKEHEYTKKAIAQYKKALKHEYVVKATATLKKMIKITKDKIEELKAHPTTKKYQNKAQKKMNELKKQMKVYQQKLNKLMKHPKTKKAIKVLKQLQKSGKFTFDELVKKMMPHYKAVITVINSQMETMPVKVQQAFDYFRQNPEEAFWFSIEMMTGMAKDSYVAVSKVDKKMIKEKSALYTNMARDYVMNTVDEVTDQWTKDTAKKMYKNSVKMAKKMENKARKMPSMVTKMAKKAYKENMQALKQWCKKTLKNLNKQWNNCPYKVFVDNEIWSDMAQEIVNHELTEAGINVANLAQQKAIELKSLAIKEMKRQKRIIEKKLKELKVQMNNKYDELKLKAKQQYKELINKYNNLVAKANNFVETTTIAHIVEYGQEKYNELISKVEQAKVDLLLAKEKYIKQGKALYVKYKKDAAVEYNKLVIRLKALYKKHVEPTLNKYKSKAMEVYNKYYPQVEAKYNELRERAEEKYAIYTQKAKEMYDAYRVKGKELMKKTKRQAYNKWMKSEVRSKLIELKGMTIRETIEALKKLPKQTKFFVLAQYKKYSTLAKVEFNLRYEKMLKEMNLRREQIKEITRPYTVHIIRVARWVENEIKETGIFVYRYYRIQENSMKLRDFIKAETKRLTAEAERLAPILKENIKKYAEEYKIKSQQLAYDYASAAGDKTLRGFHSTLKYIDNIDIKKMQKSARSYFTEINKYITIDVVKGEILITVPHREVTPKISHHIRKVGEKAKRTVRNIKAEGKKMMKKINSELAKLKVKAQKLRKQIQQQFLDNTVELRKDFKLSYNINKKIAQRVYDNAKLFGQKTYKKAMLKYKTLKSKAAVYLRKAKTMSKAYYKKFMAASQQAYLKSSEILLDIYSAGPFGMHSKSYFYAQKYYGMAQKKVTKLYRKHKPTAQKMYKKYNTMLKVEAKKMKKDILPYYQALKKAVTQVRRGVSMKKAFKPIYHQLIFASRIYQRKMIKSMSQMKSMFCRRDPKLCKHLRESMKVHEKLFEKYSLQLIDLIATGKAHLHRAVRKMTKCTRKPILGTNYNVAATIFGNHVLTFDNKYFEMIENTKAGCGYLLAHDFSNNQFTLSKEGEAIVVKTPDMSITINSNGKTSTKIGKEVIKSLPVETKSGHCVRKDSLVICHFMSKSFKVVVDLKNGITTLSMSGWYYGKTRGIFGTYNRESYDDWKLPNGKVTSDVYKFINAYELSGKSKCQLKAKTAKPKPCNKAPSTKCEQIFKDSSSPYAKHFESVNPEPFWQACVADTSSCGKENTKEAYCKSVAAFAFVARANGQWTKFLAECMSYKGHDLHSEFSQTPMKKAMDVVVLLSQRSNQQKLKKSYSKFLTQLNAMLKNGKKLNIRYSLIGFGGEGINEKAHLQPIGTGHDVFGNLQELVTEMTSIKYDGKDSTTNDAYHAILSASQLHFRPGANKVFIMFNSEPHSSYKDGPTLEEAKYALEKEAEASLFVFDEFNFKRINKRQGKMIGQSTRKLYTTKHSKKGLVRNQELPSSEYKTMVRDSEGGMFSSKIYNTRQTANAVYDVMQRNVRQNAEHCKLCRVIASWTGVTKVSCQSQKGLKC